MEMEWLTGKMSKFLHRKQNQNDAEPLVAVEKNASLTTSIEPTPGMRRILRTSDGHDLYLFEKDVKFLNTISHMIDDLSITGDDQDVITVPIAMTEAEFLKILEWCRGRTDNIGSDVLVAQIFADFSTYDLLRCIDAANYLDVKELPKALAKAAAKQLAGKSVEERRVMLHREKGFTPLDADDLAELEASKKYIFPPPPPATHKFEIPIEETSPSNLTSSFE